MLLALAGSAPHAWSADFKPNLGQAKEIIAGREIERAAIPDTAPERGVYLIPEEHPRQILTALPGQPFRPMTPMPLARAWWKYPLYAVAGLPRDLIDTLAGGLNFVPLVNIPVVMGGYELVPTQFLIRDPRDWHQWPGTRMNARGHGPIDGDSWGWFPSLRSWQFSYPSQTLARENELYNKQLKDQLDAENQKIETENARLEARLRDARTRALEAIGAGNGREAALRMIGFSGNYPLDEGGFALFTTALALFASEKAPEWVAPVLWGELEYAQPRMLAEAEKMLASTARQQPDRTALSEALIYIRLTLGRNQGAADAAQALLKERPTDPYRQRLVFETALENGDGILARKTREAMSPISYDEPTRQLMDLRLILQGGDAGPAVEPLARLQSQHPDDPYYAYYLGCAKLLLAQKLENPAATYQQGAALLNRSFELPSCPPMRLRIESSRTWVASVLAGISTNQALFTDTGSTTGTAPVAAPKAPKAGAAPKSETSPKMGIMPKTGTPKAKSKK